MITLLIGTFIAFIIRHIKNKNAKKSILNEELGNWNEMALKIKQNLHVFTRRKIIMVKGRNGRFARQVNQLRVFVNNPFGPVLDPLLKIYTASMDLASRNRAIRRIRTYYSREEQWVRVPISFQSALARRSQSAGLNFIRLNTRRNYLYL